MQINDYSYHPPLQFRTDGSRSTDPLPDKKYIGVELEVEAVVGDGSRGAGNRAYEVARRIPDDFQQSLGFWLKYDGSLRDGFEIVTDPRTARDFSLEKEAWGRFFQWLVQNGMRSYESGRCGLHMHMSLSHFDNPAHTMRALEFLSKDPQFTLKVTRRTTRGMSEYARLASEATVKDAMFASTFQEICSYGFSGISRHSVAHISRYNTFELRAFRGTLNLESFYGYLDFSRALAEWTKDPQCRHVGVPEFMEFCRKWYPVVHRLCEKALKKKLSSTESINLPYIRDERRTSRRKRDEWRRRITNGGRVVPLFVPQTYPRQWTPRSFFDRLGAVNAHDLAGMGLALFARPNLVALTPICQAIRVVEDYCYDYFDWQVTNLDSERPGWFVANFPHNIQLREEVFGEIALNSSTGMPSLTDVQSHTVDELHILIHRMPTMMGRPWQLYWQFACSPSRIINPEDMDDYKRFVAPYKYIPATRYVPLHSEFSPFRHLNGMTAKLVIVPTTLVCGVQGDADVDRREHDTSGEAGYPDYLGEWEALMRDIWQSCMNTRSLLNRGASSPLERDLLGARMNRRYAIMRHVEPVELVELVEPLTPEYMSSPNATMNAPTASHVSEVFFDDIIDEPEEEEQF